MSLNIIYLFLIFKKQVDVNKQVKSLFTECSNTEMLTNRWSSKCVRFNNELT